MNTIKLCNPRTYAQSGYRRAEKTPKGALGTKKSQATAPSVRRQPHLLIHAALILTIVFVFASWGADQIRAQRTAMALGQSLTVPETQGLPDA